MNHAELCYMTRPLRAIGRHHHISAGPSQLDQGFERAGTSTRTRPPYRLMAESGDDPRDDFSVAMPADQYMRACPSIADRDHQLLGMPESQNDVSPVPIQRIDRFVTAGLKAHRTRNTADSRGSNRRQKRTLQPAFARFDKLRHSSHPGIAWHAAGDTRLPVAAVSHENPFQQ